MPFKEFMNLPSNEFELFILIANEVQENYSLYHWRDYYLHLTDSGNRQSLIDEVHELSAMDDPWHFTYIERDRHACILLRSDEESITMLLCGEYEEAYVKVTTKQVFFLDGPARSTLPSMRTVPLTAMQIMEAFGLVPGSSHAFRVDET